MADQPIIKLDMDGVLVDVHRHAHFPRLREEMGVDLSPDDLVRFDYYKYLPEDVADFIIDTWHDPELYEDIPPVPGAFNAVEYLRCLGRVIIVSSPLQGHASSKMSWLERHGFDRKNVALAADKTVLKGDLLIDDAAHNVQEAEEPAILVDRPYNQHIDWSPRAHSWGGIMDAAYDLLKGS